MKENIQKILDDLKMYYKNYNYLIERGLNDEALKQLYRCRGMTEVLARAEGIITRETFVDVSSTTSNYVWEWEDATPMKSILFIEGDSVIEDYKIV